MADEHLDPANRIGLATADLDELDRLRLMLGQETFNEIQQRVWNEYIATHEPPYAPGIWQALLRELRASVRH